MRHIFTLSLMSTLTVACAADPQQPPAMVQLPPNHGVHTINHVPGGGNGFAFFGGGSSFTINGPTAPGSATFTNAPMADPNVTGPVNPGGGSMNITVNGTAYTFATLASVAVDFIDGTSPEYIAVDGYTTYAGPGGVTYAAEAVVITLASDFGVGATVQLDGQDRVALFATGPETAQDPTLVAAAVTGSVTFTAGMVSTTGSLSANVAGDFGEIQYTPGGGGGGGGGTNNIVAGSYTLALAGAAEVYCDGALAGQEAAFAGITLANLGLVGGTVTVTQPSAATVGIAGAPIAAGFGAGSLALDAQDTPPSLFAGFTSETGAGPAATTLVGKYLVVDGSSASAMFVNGGVGAGYVSADGQSTCSVSFGAALTAI